MHAVHHAIHSWNQTSPVAVADGKAERFFVDGKVVALHPTMLLAALFRHDDLVDAMLSRFAIRSVRRIPQPNATPVHAAVGSV
jgi:hypothetical protein